MLEAKEVKLGYMEKPEPKVVIDGLSFELDRGDILCILGANGCGKTTLFRTILGFEPLLGGNILLDGKKASEMSRTELARAVAYVPQYHTPPFPYSVLDVVLMGRNAHLKGLSAPKEEDSIYAQEALEKLKILHLKDEVYTKLSGGERQLVLIARALAQASGYILMDEPSANLDYGNRIRLMKVIKELAASGTGICFTTHEPDQAFLTQARVLAITGKNRWVCGDACEVIDKSLLKEMYGIDGKITEYETDDGSRYRQVSAGLSISKE